MIFLFMIAAMRRFTKSRKAAKGMPAAEAIASIERMIASRKPHYLVTANVDFITQAQSDVELRRILLDAHLVLCDGTPLVWASQIRSSTVPNE